MRFCHAPGGLYLRGSQTEPCRSAFNQSLGALVSAKAGEGLAQSLGPVTREYLLSRFDTACRRFLRERYMIGLERVVRIELSANSKLDIER